MVKAKPNPHNHIREFKSLNAFYEYISTTPTNSTFKGIKKSSQKTSKSSKEFTGTASYAEAVSLFQNGWDKTAKLLTQKLKVAQGKTDAKFTQKQIYDIVGFQCSVPRYLQGLPTNMVNKHITPTKERVITINKDICYSWIVTKEMIIEESVKALSLVQQIEKQGVRVNLNIVFFAKEGAEIEGCKVRIKNANERVNISKMAFPLVHPSMLRRLMFRYIEVSPTTASGFTDGYGSPLDNDKIREICKGEYVLPRFINENVKELSDLAAYYSEK